MDPITCLESLLDSTEPGDVAEWMDIYNDWIAKGGFPAPKKLLNRAIVHHWNICTAPAFI